jgi:hypothetical protein
VPQKEAKWQPTISNATIPSPPQGAAILELSRLARPAKTFALPSAKLAKGAGDGDATGAAIDQISGFLNI